MTDTSTSLAADPRCAAGPQRSSASDRSYIHDRRPSQRHNGLLSYRSIRHAPIVAVTFTFYSGSIAKARPPLAGHDHGAVIVPTLKWVLIVAVLTFLASLLGAVVLAVGMSGMVNLFAIAAVALFLMWRWSSASR